jgi:hypothetical protein
MNLNGLEDVLRLPVCSLNVILTEKSSLIRAITAYYTEINTRQAARRANIHAGKLAEVLPVTDGDDETPIINRLTA